MPLCYSCSSQTIAKRRTNNGANPRFSKCAEYTWIRINEGPFSRRVYRMFTHCNSSVAPAEGGLEADNGANVYVVKDDLETQSVLVLHTGPFH